MSGFWASCLRKQLPDIYRCNRSNRNRLSFLGGDSDYFFAHYTVFNTSVCVAVTKLITETNYNYILFWFIAGIL